MPKILFVTSEAHPLIKTGGLADVSGALPIALKALKCNVRIILPAYPEALQNLKKVKIVKEIYIPGIPGFVNLLESNLANSTLKVLLVDYDAAYKRQGGPYVDSNGQPWIDNAERFALFAKVVAKVALNQTGLNWQPDIVHCNDWQTGLVPALLNFEKQRPQTIFTIHNLAYQGLFSQRVFQALGLHPDLWTYSALEFHNKMSFIKGGLVFADHITTVSPQYALEIQTPKFGYGLEGLLRSRETHLTGILNGIDDNIWNPATDKHLVANYDKHNLVNKALNKQALQAEFGLEQSKSHFLIGFIGRLVEQKGIDLIAKTIPKFVDLPIQIVILGTGETKFESLLESLAHKYSSIFKVNIGYDEALAHKIEAGLDAFLMPSRFEPCGLNQMYSLRYGTIPIVHRVGGLADTVVDVTEKSLASSTATGIVFEKPTSEALFQATLRALDLYTSPAKCELVKKSGMKKNFNWRASAKQYLRLYQSVLNPV